MQVLLQQTALIQIWFLIICHSDQEVQELTRMYNFSSKQSAAWRRYWLSSPTAMPCWHNCTWSARHHSCSASQWNCQRTCPRPRNWHKLTECHVVNGQSLWPCTVRPISPMHSLKPVHFGWYGDREDSIIVHPISYAVVNMTLGIHRHSSVSNLWIGHSCVWAQYGLSLNH